MEIDKQAIFERAAQIVRERGWGKGNKSMGEQYGPVCILGACKVALDETGLDWLHGGYTDPYDGLKEVSVWTTLVELTGMNRPYSWNDRVATSGHEVIDKLLEAAQYEADKKLIPQ